MVNVTSFRVLLVAPVDLVLLVLQDHKVAEVLTVLKAQSVHLDLLVVQVQLVLPALVSPVLAAKRETLVFPENKEERVTKVPVVPLVNRVIPVPLVLMVSKVHLVLASVVNEVLPVTKDSKVLPVQWVSAAKLVLTASQVSLASKV